MRIFGVVHECFITDRSGFTTTHFVVLDDSYGKEKVLEAYNRLAATRTKYPYMWSQAELRDVYEMKTETIEGEPDVNIRLLGMERG